MFPYMTGAKSPLLPFLWYAADHVGVPGELTGCGIGLQIQYLCLVVFL